MSSGPIELHKNIDNQRNYELNFSNFAVSSGPAGELALLGLV